MTQLLSSLSFRSVLDVGCGDGSLLGFLKDRFGCEIYGLESDDSPANTRVPLNGYYRMDITAQHPKRSFDVVIASEVLEHIPEQERGLRNMHAVSNRYLLLTVPGEPIRETDKYMGHVRHYDLGSLDQVVTSCGFRVIRSFAWGFPFHSTYKLMQDIFPEVMIQGFGTGEYGWTQKTVCNLLYGLFHLNLSRFGSQLFLLGEKA